MIMSMLLCLRIRSRPVKSMYSYLLFRRNMIQIKDVKVKSRKTNRTSQIETLRHNLQQVRAQRKKLTHINNINFQMFLKVTCTVLHTFMGNRKFLDSVRRWPKHTKTPAQTSTKWLLTIDLHGKINWSNQTPKTTMMITPNSWASSKTTISCKTRSNQVSIPTKNKLWAFLLTNYNN